MFRRMKGKALHVAPSAAALRSLGMALRQTAVDLAAAAPLQPTKAAPFRASASSPFQADSDVERTLNVKPPAVESHVLEILAPASAAQRITVRPPLTIGRAAPCDLLLAGSEVSRSHCRIDSDGGRLTMTDLNSTNGTYVNDRRIAGTAALTSGDLVRIGGFVLLYEDQGATLDRTQRGRAGEI